MADESPERTESLFDVTPARRRTYLVSFVAFSLIGYGVVIWHHVTNGAAAAACENATGQACAGATAMSVMLGLAIAHAAAFGLALTTAEITGGTMVIADWLRTKLVEPLQDSLREEGREAGGKEGEERGRAEANDNWRAWLQRRQEAEARGEEFNEPEPYSDEQ